MDRNEPEKYTDGVIEYWITPDESGYGYAVDVHDLTRIFDKGRRVAWFDILPDARQFVTGRTTPNGKTAAAPSVTTSGAPMGFNESRRNLRISDLFRIRRDYLAALQQSREILQSAAHLGDNSGAIVQTEAYAELVQSDAENRYIHLTLFTIGELAALDELGRMSDMLKESVKNAAKI
jgi:hypothetical protein